MWLVVVRRYRDILIIIITFPYSTCISSFFGSSISYKAQGMLVLECSKSFMPRFDNND